VHAVVRFKLHDQHAGFPGIRVRVRVSCSRFRPSAFRLAQKNSNCPARLSRPGRRVTVDSEVTVGRRHRPGNSTGLNLKSVPLVVRRQDPHSAARDAPRPGRRRSPGTSSCHPSCCLSKAAKRVTDSDSLDRLIHLESCTPGTRQYKIVRTGTYQYILFWIRGGTRKGKIVHTSTDVAVLTYDISMAVHTGMYWYVLYNKKRYKEVQPGIKRYTVVQHLES
jgi:hypothetical protein